MNRGELICYCYSVTQEELLSAIAAGAGTLGALRAGLGVTGSCGGCAHRVRACLKDAAGLAQPDQLDSSLSRPPLSSATF